MGGMLNGMLWPLVGGGVAGLFAGLAIISAIHRSAWGHWRFWRFEDRRPRRR